MIPSFLLFIMIYIMSFIYVLNMDDWIMIWLGLELNMMTYIIMVYKQYDMLVLESCFKYFLIQSLGSALLLVMFYLNKSLLMMVILLLSYKLGAGPFFYWFPSVCSGLGWLACYLLMTFQKSLPLFLMSGFFHKIMWWVVILSLVLGAFGSFNQINMKQLLAYSSVHHLGWLILIVFSNDLFWMWYLLIYSFMLIGLIYYLMMYDINNIFMLKKYNNKMWFMMGMLSMGGMPPMLGFFLKWASFLYILLVSYIYITFLVLMSVIMLYIYMRVVYDTFMMISINMGWYYQYDSVLLYKMDYMTIFGMFSGLMMGLFLII